jgi:hypothetical protein
MVILLGSGVGVDSTGAWRGKEIRDGVRMSAGTQPESTRFAKV